MFSAATSVRPEPGGGFAAEIAPGWDIAGNANGGYLLAIAARALSDATGRADPVTVTGHYLAPGKPGPLTIAVQVVKEGRSFSTASALLSADRPVLAVLGTFGDLTDSAEGEGLILGGPPVLPPPQDCEEIEATETFPPPFMDKVELRLHPDDAGFFHGHPSGDARMRGWFRLRDGEPMDTVALLCAVDAFPPTVLNASVPTAWVPTVELTAHVRGRPEGDWLACSFSTRFVSGGFLEADGEVWDERGVLVAQSRQLALVPRPPEGPAD